MISKTSKEKFVKSTSSEEKVQNIREICGRIRKILGRVWTIISSVTNPLVAYVIRTYLFRSTVSPLNFTVQFSWSTEGQFHKI